MIEMSISVTGGEQPEKLALAGKTASLMRRLGTIGAREIKAYYRGLEQTRPNQMGWPRRHFWNGIAKAVALESSDETTATVGIASPELAHKITGGTLTPSRAQMLAIPLTAEAYKMGSPRAWLAKNEAFVIKRKGDMGRAFLARYTDGKYNQLEILYMLVKSVTQAPDPDADVPMAQIEPVLVAETDRWLSEHVEAATGK